MQMFIDVNVIFFASLSADRKRNFFLCMEIKRGCLSEALELEFYFGMESKRDCLSETL